MISPETKLRLELPARLVALRETINLGRTHIDKIMELYQEANAASLPPRLFETYKNVRETQLLLLKARYLACLATISVESEPTQTKEGS